MQIGARKSKFWVQSLKTSKDEILQSLGEESLIDFCVWTSSESEIPFRGTHHLET